MHKEPFVYIMLISFNQEKDTLECLHSLRSLDYKNYRVILVDNGSVDSLSEKVYSDFKDIKLIKLNSNVGAAAGRNIGINYALKKGCEYIFFLDNDAVVEPSTLTELVKVAETDSKIVAVGAKTYYYDEPKKIWNFGGKICWLKGKFIDTQQGKFDNGQFDSGKEVDTFPIGFGIVRTDVIKKVGEIDERYFVYYEETDWHVRMKRVGHRIVVTPKAKIWHKASSALGMESPFFYYYRTRSRLLFMFKNAPKIYLPFFFLYFIYDFSYNTLLTLFLSERPNQLHAAVIGLFDFIRGRFGKRTLSDKLLNTPLYRTITIRFCDKIGNFLIKEASSIKFITKRLFKLRLKILVKLDWNLGDEIMVIPVYQAIKEKYPKSIINVEVKFSDLLVHNPYVDEINSEDRKYDRIINLKGENKTEKRIDYLSRKLKLNIKDKIPKIYIEESKRKNLYSSAVFSDNAIRKNLCSSMMKVAISTGAQWKSRQWGVNNFKKLAEYLIDKYDAQIIELGKNCQSIGLGLNLINKTSVSEAAIILKRCNLFIGNDSGLVHLALAIGASTIGLYGPLNPNNLIENKEIFYPVLSKIDCQSCWSDGRMKYPGVCPKGIPNCMEKIDFKTVITKVDKVLSDLNVTMKELQDIKDN